MLSLLLLLLFVVSSAVRLIEDIDHMLIHLSIFGVNEKINKNSCNNLINYGKIKSKYKINL